MRISFNLDLRRNPYKGKYIAIEGIDGSGKSTQVERLTAYFEKHERHVVVTSEPRRDLPVGTIIQQILQAKTHIPPSSYQFLYSANRVENHEKIIYPALKKGDVVLSHRSIWSIVPYGIEDFGLSVIEKEKADSLFAAHGVLSEFHQFIAPDITFYLRVSVDTALQRLGAMNKMKEIYEKKEKLAIIAKGYEWEAQQFSKELVIIDGEKQEEEVSQEIITYVSRFV